MASIGQAITVGTALLQIQQLAQDGLRLSARRRLGQAFEAAREVVLDDSSRLIFFSDLHRGDGSRADAFAKNEHLFLQALSHYYSQGFTYVEVGDGDELWKNRQFSVVRQAHEAVFGLLHHFHDQGRLHLLVGNHDLQGMGRRSMEKDGMMAREGLLLRHSRTGHGIFVVHGHQADFQSDGLAVVSRFVVRNIWKRLQLFGHASARSLEEVERDSEPLQRLYAWIEDQKNRIEQRIIEWLEPRRQMTICGHTHHPRFAMVGEAPYFNTGSCVFPGYITGLEIQGGEIALVRWSATRDRRADGTPQAVRQIVVPPRRLALFAV